jgi:hypothetical protein
MPKYKSLLEWMLFGTENQVRLTDNVVIERTGKPRRKLTDKEWLTFVTVSNALPVMDEPVTETTKSDE